MVLHPYQASWPRDFQRLARVLERALDGLGVSVEHVGSTAMPGLAAKPLLDIDLAYPPTVTLVAVTARLQTLGYRHAGDQGIPGREVFKRPVTEAPHPVLDHLAHHLYACPVKGEELLRHQQFRDGLRGSERLRQRYEDLKTRLAAQAGQDKKKYAALKQIHAPSFVAEVLAQVAHTAARSR